MTILDRAKGLHRYYRNRIIENYAATRWQVSYAISVELLDMVENKADNLQQIEDLRTYADSMEDIAFHSAWMDLIGTIEAYRQEVQAKRI